MGERARPLTRCDTCSQSTQPVRTSVERGRRLRAAALLGTRFGSTPITSAGKGWPIGGPYDVKDARFPTTKYRGSDDGAVIYADGDKANSVVKEQTEHGMLHAFDAGADMWSRWNQSAPAPPSRGGPPSLPGLVPQIPALPLITRIPITVP